MKKLSVRKLEVIKTTAALYAAGLAHSRLVTVAFACRVGTYPAPGHTHTESTSKPVPKPRLFRNIERRTHRRVAVQ